MKRLLYVLIGVLLSGALFGGAALATGDDKGADATAESGAEATVAAQAPYARMALYINGNPGGFAILRAKGVISVSNPQPGVFCIRPVAAIAPSRVVPNVSTDFYSTGGFDTFAQWNSGRTSCPAGRIQVNTFDASSTAAFNDVAFTVTVN